ncbi:Altered inheritance of mitochondria protein 24, mitochondrial [Ascosphaera acerosa]|nr:Altered inheritance of mitochondria protein 24, mitochondrial [Ascosphaera acerosa]
MIAEATFQVVGTPFSLLSASLSPSQSLFTRRGTLVGLSGKAENVVSRLAMQEPMRRAVMGIPFMYQKITAASPINALISTRSPVTSFTTVEVDGTVDWMIAQRSALLAWTGYTLRFTPSLGRNMVSRLPTGGRPCDVRALQAWQWSLTAGLYACAQSLAQFGNSRVTGRGLMALAGRGQIYSVDLQEGEKYIAHPSNILAYSICHDGPTPYRFKSTTLNLQIPDLGRSQWLQRYQPIRDLTASEAWRRARQAWHTFVTWSRRTLWGDRLFLQFQGPARILIQSRGSSLTETLTTRQVSEIARCPPGVSSSAIREPQPVAVASEVEQAPASQQPTSQQ